jgi:hypothetical protein
MNMEASWKLKAGKPKNPKSEKPKYPIDQRLTGISALESSPLSL